MHDESQVCFGLGGQHTSRSKTGVIDEGSVVVPFPLDGIGRVGDDGFKRFLIPVHGFGERVPVGNVKLVIVDVMQKHIDPAEVVGGDIDLLPKETLPHFVPT